MDRLPPVIYRILPLVCLFACAGSEPAVAPPSRVAAVGAAKVEARRLDGFCDQRHAAADAPAFTWPALTGAVPAVEGWHWVNVWATWCGPCVAEMPMLTQWQQKLSRPERPVTLTFLSFDEEHAKVDRFEKTHPELPVGLRLAPGTDPKAWLPQVGREPTAAIPLHFLLDPAGRVRCVREGAVDPGDLDILQALIDG
jgi:thiol-disulfide isomerase/thioredoxin